MLLLHTTGRTSGLERSTTLAFVEDDAGSLFLVGGAGGQVRIPDWVTNLRSRPQANVTISRRRFDVTAKELAGLERTKVWQWLTPVWPQIDTYERRRPAGPSLPSDTHEQ